MGLQEGASIFLLGRPSAGAPGPTESKKGHKPLKPKPLCPVFREMCCPLQPPAAAPAPLRRSGGDSYGGLASTKEKCRAGKLPSRYNQLRGDRT